MVGRHHESTEAQQEAWGRYRRTVLTCGRRGVPAQNSATAATPAAAATTTQTAAERKGKRTTSCKCRECREYIHYRRGTDYRYNTTAVPSTKIEQTPELPQQALTYDQVGTWCRRVPQQLLLPSGETTTSETSTGASRQELRKNIVAVLTGLFLAAGNRRLCSTAANAVGQILAKQKNTLSPNASETSPPITTSTFLHVLQTFFTTGLAPSLRLKWPTKAQEGSAHELWSTGFRERSTQDLLLGVDTLISFPVTAIRGQLHKILRHYSYDQVILQFLLETACGAVVARGEVVNGTSASQLEHCVAVLKLLAMTLQKFPNTLSSLAEIDNWFAPQQQQQEQQQGESPFDHLVRSVKSCLLPLLLAQHTPQSHDQNNNDSNKVSEDVPQQQKASSKAAAKQRPRSRSRPGQPHNCDRHTQDRRVFQLALLAARILLAMDTSLSRQNNTTTTNNRNSGAIVNTLHRWVSGAACSPGATTKASTDDIFDPSSAPPEPFAQMLLFRAWLGMGLQTVQRQSQLFLGVWDKFQRWASAHATTSVRGGALEAMGEWLRVVEVWVADSSCSPEVNLFVLR